VKQIFICSDTECNNIFIKYEKIGIICLQYKRFEA